MTQLTNDVVSKEAVHLTNTLVSEAVHGGGCAVTVLWLCMGVAQVAQVAVEAQVAQVAVVAEVAQHHVIEASNRRVSLRS